MSSKSKTKPASYLLLLATIGCLLILNAPSIKAEENKTTEQPNPVTKSAPQKIEPVASSSTPTPINNVSSSIPTNNQSSVPSLSPTSSTAAPASSTAPTSTAAPATTTSNCLNNGTPSKSNSDLCECGKDFFGNRCEYVKCDDAIKNQCRNGGLCLQHYTKNNSMLTMCKCKPTFKGALCERPVCEGFCENDGRCTDGLGDEFEFPDNSTLTANLTCTCPSARYMGSQCQFDKCESKIDPKKSSCYLNGTTCAYQCDDECRNAYCFKKGKCFSNEKKQLACLCDVGFSGPTCAIDDCRGYCFNDGVCSVNVNRTLSCKCAENFDGERCHKQIKTAQADSSKSENPGGTGMRSVIYSFTFILAICLVCIGVYYLYQKGAFRGIDRFKSGGAGGSGSPGSGSTRSFFRTNFSFNKLEDQQAITQHDELDQTDTV